jgi:hypothetical protein
MSERLNSIIGCFVRLVEKIKNMEKSYFVNPNDTANTKLHQLIRTWVKDKFTLDEPFELSVSEIKCADVGCPDIDTYITFVKDKQSRKFRIAKPLVYVRKWDIDSMRESNVS